MSNSCELFRIHSSPAKHILVGFEKCGHVDVTDLNKVSESDGKGGGSFTLFTM